MSTKLYIGNLSGRTTKNDITDIFEKYGKIVRVDLKEGYGFIEYESSSSAEEAIEKMHRFDLNGRSLIVETSYSKGPRTAEQFKEDYERRYDRGRGRDRGYDRRDYGRDRDRGYYGRDRDRGYGRSRYSGRGFGGPDHYRSQNRNYKIKISNLSSRVSWQDLKDFGRDKIGESVIRSDVFQDDRGNFGVLEITDRGDYDYALDKMSGQMLEGREITVRRYSSEDERRDRLHSRRRSPQKRSRYYDRSRSRDRRSPSSKRSRSDSRSNSRSRSRSFPKEALKKSPESGPEKRERSSSKGEDESSAKQMKVENNSAEQLDENKQNGSVGLERKFDDKGKDGDSEKNDEKKAEDGVQEKINDDKANDETKESVKGDDKINDGEVKEGVTLANAVDGEKPDLEDGDKKVEKANDDIDMAGEKAVDGGEK